MFWLFKRKKVADKKAITPCVCDNGDHLPDALTLQDFGTRSILEGSISSRLGTTNESRYDRKGYHRLQADGSGADDITVIEPPSPVHDTLTYGKMTVVQPEVSECSDPGSSTESSSDYERDYFGGFTDTDEDEELTCNVCERSFNSVRKLEQHQQRKRHYGCSICDSIFPGLMALELHKETLDHWSDYELRVKQVHEEDKESDSEEELEEHRVYSGRTRDELRRLLL
ncbi:uncharacterized protein [Parasteatoda tepidariorum]|uniref:uncharacterized protein n=1 Tax=Parasteatoda tepidariorum TaxID=114398 RepID=UPI00077FCB91|nr:uncharacterized protein LOC107450191 [Parasteatoda tepidariorum]